MDIKQFFGLPLDQNIYDIDQLSDLIGLKAQINENKTVRHLIINTSPNHSIVSIGKRQQLLKKLKGLLEHKLLPYDELWYKKAVNTASDIDRQYEAQDKLIYYCIILASGKTFQEIKNLNIKPDIATIRGTNDRERYQLLWTVLANNTNEAISQFRKDKSGGDNAKQSLADKIKGFISSLSQKADP